MNTIDTETRLLCIIYVCFNSSDFINAVTSLVVPIKLCLDNCGCTAIKVQLKQTTETLFIKGIIDLKIQVRSD